MDSRVFWAVLCALLVFSGIMWTLVALGVFGMRVAANQAAQQAQAELASQVEESRQQAAAAQAVDLARRTLAENQRCYGGAVVQFDGTAYTQIGTIANPIHCTGRLADKPLR